MEFRVWQISSEDVSKPSIALHGLVARVCGLNESYLTPQNQVLVREGRLQAVHCA